jgi:hypothetical protein
VMVRWDMKSAIGAAEDKGACPRCITACLCLADARQMANLVSLLLCHAEEVNCDQWVLGVVTDMGEDTYWNAENKKTFGMQVTTYKFYFLPRDGALEKDMSQHEVINVVYPDNYEDVR